MGFKGQTSERDAINVCFQTAPESEFNSPARLLLIAFLLELEDRLQHSEPEQLWVTGEPGGAGVTQAVKDIMKDATC